MSTYPLTERAELSEAEKTRRPTIGAHGTPTKKKSRHFLPRGRRFTRRTDGEGASMFEVDTVSVSALVKRVNRNLRPKGWALKRPRGARSRCELGAFYILEPMRNVIVATDVSLELLARELGVLDPHERVFG